MPLLTTETFLPSNIILPAPNKGKAACIGSGPASLACAAALRVKGFDVTVFEALPKPGGSLTYAVPEYKLAQVLVDTQIKRLEEAGIKIIVNTPFCTSFNVKQLAKMGFQAVFLGTGLWKDKKIIIGGADLDGVFNSSAFLALTKFGGLALSPSDSVVVTGSGCAAIHSATVAALQGAGNVFLISRSALKEFKADKEDIAFAQSLGISFLYGFEIKKVIGKNGKVTAIRAKNTSATSEIELEATKTVFAFGRVFSKPNAGCSLMMSKNELIETRNFATTKEGYFSGGDAVRGRSSVAQSVADGQKAAEQIALFIQNSKNQAV